MVMATSTLKSYPCIDELEQIYVYMHDITLKAVKLDVASNYIPFEEGLAPYLKNHFLIPFSQRCTSQVWLKLTQ